jgi:protoporphyrin/coproporphyrin ferrochelatase
LKASHPEFYFKTFLAMRYWHPFVAETLAELETFQPDEIIALPLYPQFSKTTTLSSFVSFKSAYKGKARVRFICCYPANDEFINAQVTNINKITQDIDNPDDYVILFSAHGLPEKIIKEGDPYQSQIELSVSKIMARLGDRFKHIICYQSRVGPLKWIGPPTDKIIEETVKAGKSPIIVPIAFVSEHIETLVELDIEYRHMADEMGVKDYRRVPAVRADSQFIEALRSEIMSAMNSDNMMISAHNCEACHKFCPKQKAI